MLLLLLLLFWDITSHCLLVRNITDKLHLWYFVYSPFPLSNKQCILGKGCSITQDAPEYSTVSIKSHNNQRLSLCRLLIKYLYFSKPVRVATFSLHQDLLYFLTDKWSKQSITPYIYLYSQVDIWCKRNWLNCKVFSKKSFK